MAQDPTFAYVTGNPDFLWRRKASWCYATTTNRCGFQFGQKANGWQFSGRDWSLTTHGHRSRWFALTARLPHSPNRSISPQGVGVKRLIVAISVHWDNLPLLRLGAARRFLHNKSSLRPSPSIGVQNKAAEVIHNIEISATGGDDIP